MNSEDLIFIAFIAMVVTASTSIFIWDGSDMLHYSTRYADNTRIEHKDDYYSIYSTEERGLPLPYETTYIFYDETSKMITYSQDLSLNTLLLDGLIWFLIILLSVESFNKIKGR